MTYWAIYEPGGYLMYQQIRYRRKEAISDFLELVGAESDQWQWYVKEGYRCCKVAITRSNP